jgi:ABC-type lipoprotein export system ATPase subunit
MATDSAPRSQSSSRPIGDAAASNNPLIETRDLVKTYVEGTVRTPVLRGVNLTVLAGEVIALLGPSGCGKSTLLNILGCLDRPTSGQYLLGGRDVSHLTREEQAWVRLHYLGFIFQAFHLIAHASALENVALPLYYAGIDAKTREQRAAEMLTAVGLGDRLHYRPDQLSGGQRQRVAIARACVAHPKVLFADEPTGALDTTSGVEVLELLARLHEESGLTIVLVTHDHRVAAVAQRRLEMRDGTIVQATPAQEIAYA